MPKHYFNVTDVLPIALTLVVFGIGIAFGLNVLGETREDLAESDCPNYWNTTAQACHVSATNSTVTQLNNWDYNATQDALQGTAKLPEKLPLIVTIVVAAIVIGILLRYLLRG